MGLAVVSRYLRELQKPPLSRSNRTYNAYMKAMKAFMAYMVQCKVINSSPLGGITSLNPDRDPKRLRRALTFAEFDSLIAHAKTIKAGHGRASRSGAWYVAFYLVAGRCGSRGAEAAKLQWRHIRFDPSKEILFAADITKTGEAGVVPLSDEVAAALLALKPSVARDSDLVFGGMPTRKTFENHLKRASVAYLDDLNQVVSLRKTFGSHLISRGVQPRQVQLLMRHAKIETTFKHYSDPRMVDLRQSIGKLSE